MHTLTRHGLVRARIAWIACLAILLNAFAPLVSHAMEAPASAAMTIEVCTAMGMTAMPVALAAAADGADGSSAGKHKAMHHCGYCLFHAASHGLPPLPPAIAFAASASRDVYPPLYYHAPRPLFPWSLAQSRAPPFA